MSLLDDVSIVVTPNGYKAGELYAVIPVPTEGAELVTNGDFATDSVWAKAPSGVTISGGSANFNSATDTYVYQDILTANKTYKVIFSGTINSGSLYIGENGVATNIYTTGTYTNEVAYFTVASSVRFIIRRTGTGTLDATIDNVSVKEYTSADMDVTRATAATRVDENGLVNYAEIVGSELVTNGDFSNGTTGWTEEGSSTISVGTYQGRTNVANINIGNTSTSSRIQQLFDYVNGKTYQISVDVYLVSGSFRSDSRDTFVSGDFVSTSTIGSWLTLTSTFTAIQTGSDVVWLRSLSEVSQFYVDSISVKEVTRDNVPRIDYTGGGCPHILAEPQRTNLVTYSEDFTSWNQIQNTTLTPSSTTSPSGDSDGTKFLSISTSAKVRENFSAVSGTTYALSVYCKNIDATLIMFLGYDGVNSFTSDLTSEVNTSTWTRISLTFTAANTGSGQIQIARDLPNGESVYFWGAQLEAGSYPTSYIPTSGSTVTRNQDIFTRDGIGSLINSTEGVLFAEWKPKISSDYSFFSINNGTSAETVTIGKNNNTTTMFLAVRHLGGYEILYTSASHDLTIFNKVAVKWKAGDYAIWVNGVEVLTSTSATIPTAMNKLSFDFGDGGFDFYGEVKQLQVYDTSLTDNQLIQLTGEAGTHFFESYAEMAEALTYTIQ